MTPVKYPTIAKETLIADLRFAEYIHKELDEQVETLGSLANKDIKYLKY